MRSITDTVTISRANDGSALVGIKVGGSGIEQESTSAVLSQAWALLAEAISAQHAGSGENEPDPAAGPWWGG